MEDKDHLLYMLDIFFILNKNNIIVKTYWKNT